MNQASSKQLDRTIAMMIGLILLIGTYAIFSVRAQLTDPAADDLFSLKRLIATTCGAALFLGLIEFVARDARRQCPARLIEISTLSALAAAIVLIVRIGYDIAIDPTVTAVLADNARWMITWLGYFLAAVGTYFGMVFGVDALRRSAAAAPVQPDLTMIVAAVAQWDAADRASLIAALAPLDAYPEADPLARLIK